MSRLFPPALLLVLSLSVQLSGQLPVPVAYEGARVITGDGRAPIENAVIVVNDGRIAQVGRAADVRVPSGAARVNLAGQDRDAGHHRHPHPPEHHP